jgi:pyruvate dehydrogenase E2 component (dihydrolipoamide acetyltransferase)
MSRVFKLPDLGEGIHEAEVVSVLVAPGDQVLEGQPILEVETDKARVEIPSPYTGKVLEIKVVPGQTIRVGAILVMFDQGPGMEVRLPGMGEAAVPPHAVAPAEIGSPPMEAGVAAVGAARPVSVEGTEPSAAQPEAAAATGPVPASPSTRRLARELGVDLHQVRGSGPHGLVTAEDIKSFAASKRQPVQPPTGEPIEATPALVLASDSVPGIATVLPPSDFARWGPVERVPLRSVRRATARRLAMAWAQIPHVNHQDLADITILDQLRRKHQSEIEGLGGKLTLTVFMLKAVVAALKRHPRFNASLDMDGEEIILKHYYHLGVAVDSERGLLVPVLRDVDHKSLSEIAVELHDLAERARNGKSTSDDLQGGTFTITNIGALGGTGFAPIINYPQVAILGMGQARWQPKVIGSETEMQIVPRLLLPLVLAFDHRLLDGADAARFVNLIIQQFEDPEEMLLMI